MDLNKQHREAFLNELQKAKGDLELQKLCRRKQLEKEDFSLVEWNEVNTFLADERIKLIEKSLIKNEIEF